MSTDHADVALVQLPQLLHKHAVCEPPLVTHAHWEKHVYRERDVVKVDLRAAGVAVLHMDVFLADVRKALERTPIQLSNIVCEERGRLELLLPPRPQRNSASKRHRETWDDEDWLEEDRKDPVEPMELLKFEEKSPLARVHRYLCTDLSEIRHGDRPLDMQIEATPRGVCVSDMHELRLSDVDYMLRHAQIIAAKFVPDTFTRHASVDVLLSPKLPMRVAVHVVADP